MTISLDFFRSFTRVIKIPSNIKEVHQLSLAVLELFVIYSIYSLGITQTATGTIYVQVSGGNKTSQDFRVHIIVTSGQGSANPSDIQGSESGTTVTFSGSALYDLEPEGMYSYDVLNVFSHAYDMHERRVLNENEWFAAC
jgi:hypothetical protein